MNRGVKRKLDSRKDETKDAQGVMRFRGNRGTNNKDRLLTMMNRSCYFNSEDEEILEPPVPDDCYCTQDFGQIVQMPSDHETLKHTENYQQMLRDQYGFDPSSENSPELMEYLKGILKSICIENAPKVDTSSQYVDPKVKSSALETPDGNQWLNIDTVNDVDRYIAADPLKLPETKNTSPVTYIWPKKQNRKTLPTTEIHIAEKPHVKIIAEKFSKAKNKNLEIRRLEEKVVCVEYDVFEANNVEKPIQKLRAFFSIKPTRNAANDVGKNVERKESKTKFHIADEDLSKLTEKEIEIIDGKIDENQSYLQDLRHVLRRNQIIKEKRKKKTLDLQYLYDIARNDKPRNDSRINFLSKGELQDVKDLILNKSTSSIHGIRRRQVNSPEHYELSKGGSFISQTFYNEIFGEAQNTE